MRWEKITLRQFQYIERVNADPQYDAMDRTMHTACILFGHTETTFGNVGLKKAQRLIKKTNQCFKRPCPEKPYNRIGRYCIDYDVDRLRFGQYVELTHFLQGNIIDNASMILASVAHLPLLKNKSEHHQRVSGYFLDQPITKVVGSVKYVIEMFGIGISSDYRTSSLGSFVASSSD